MSRTAVDPSGRPLGDDMDLDEEVDLGGLFGSLMRRAVGRAAGRAADDAQPTRITVLRDGLSEQDATWIGGALAVQHHMDLNELQDRIRETSDARIKEAIAAGELALEEMRATADQAEDAAAAELNQQRSPEGSQSASEIDDAGSGATSRASGGVDSRVGRALGGAAATAAGALAADALRQRRSRRAADEDNAPETPDTEAWGEDAMLRAEESPRPETKPDHYIGAEGVAIGSVVSGTLPSADLAGQTVRRLEESASGWTLVECLNGARCWVDPAGLRPLASYEADAPDESESMVQFWFYVVESVPVHHSDGSVLGQLEPGTWYPAHEVAGGWTSTIDSSGRSGWVDSSIINRAPHT